MTPTVQGGSGIALVDVNYIFKKHVRLQAQLTELQAEAERVQKDFEAKLQALQEEGKQLNDLKPGTPQYQTLEERLVNQQAMYKSQIALKRKEFVQKEAKLYFNAYREICEEVSYYCEHRGIILVLNFNHDNIHEESADDIARGISNKVVYHTKELDITPYILPRFIQQQQAPADNRNLMGPATGFPPR